jgi:uncharacterized iron-regulated membrane protein
MRGEQERWRQLWLRIHIILALSLGLVFAVLGLAGALSLYGEALDTWLNPELRINEAHEPRQSLDWILAAAQAAHPDRHGAWILELPRSPGGMLTAWYEKPRETAGELYAPLMVSVNPYTAEVVASRFWGRTAVTWLLDLHTQLHLGRSGWNAMGWLGVALMISAVTGIRLWWPGLRQLPQAFRMRLNAGTYRLALDSHRAVGFFSAIILLLLGFTGVNLAFPRISETLVGASGMSHGDEGPAIRSSAIPNDRPVGLDEAVLLARGPFPHAEVRRVATPDGPSGTYRISLRQRFEVNQRHPVTTVWVDQYSGQIREVRNPARFSPGETALTWLWPLHTGEALGSWGRFLWFLAGLSPLALYLTGILRWLVGQGLARGFAVDFSGVRIAGESLVRAVAVWGRALFRVLRPVASEAKSRALRCAESGGRFFRERMEKRARR